MTGRRTGRSRHATTRGTSGAPPRASDRLLQVEWVVALGATTVAVVLGTVFVQHAPALWRDEINSVNTVRLASWAEMWRTSEFDSFPLLWMLLLRGWIAIGGASSDAWLRLFGGLCGLSVPLALWFAARRSGRIVPLVSLALVAVNPHMIRWGTSVRAWSLGAALAIVCFVLIPEATASPTRRRIAFAALAAILSVQCLYQNAVLLAAVIAGSVAAQANRRQWRHALVPLGIGVAAAVSLLPYRPLIERRAQWDGLGQVPLTLGYLAARFWDVLAASGTIVTACWIAVGAVAVTSVVLRLARPAPGPDAVRRRHEAMVAMVMTGASIAGLLVFYFSFGYPTQPWYYLGLMAVVAVAADLAVASLLQARRARAVRTLLAVVVLVAGTPTAWAALEEPMTNMNHVGPRLTTDAVQGDLIVLNPWVYAISFTRYYAGPAAVVTIPPIEDMSVHRFDLLKNAMLTSDPTAPLLSRIRTTLQSGHRVWYVGRLDASPPGADPPLPGPPPLPETGWRSVRYEVAWSNRTGAFLRDHSAVTNRVNIAERGGRLEDAAAVVCSGWK